MSLKNHDFLLKTRPVQEVHDLIRGCDSAPGAYFEVMGVQVSLHGSSMVLGSGGNLITEEKLGTLPIDGNVGNGSSAIFTPQAIVVNCTGIPAGRVGELNPSDVSLSVLMCCRCVNVTRVRVNVAVLVWSVFQRRPPPPSLFFVSFCLWTVVCTGAKVGGDRKAITDPALVLEAIVDAMEAADAPVSFQWKNPDFLFRKPDFLLRIVDFII